jgi:hypothetical protein
LIRVASELSSIKFATRRVILCEGEGDCSFFRHLIAKRNLPAFDIFCPRRPYTEDGAVQGYDDMLTVFTAGQGFSDLIGILVQGDNDHDAAIKFQAIAGKIAEAEGYVAPHNPLEVARAVNRPPVVVMMMPWVNEPGCLETLCLPSAEAAFPEVKKCVDKQYECANISTWDIAKQHKMRLRMIASTCKTDPYTSLVHAWSRTENLIPLDHACFQRIVDFLANFDTYITTH